MKNFKARILVEMNNRFSAMKSTTGANQLFLDIFHNSNSQKNSTRDSKSCKSLAVFWILDYL